MSNTYGALYIQGQQTNLQGGGPQGIGAFAVPASGVQDTITVNCLASTLTTTVIPTNITPTGVLVIPPTSGIASILFKTVLADTGTYLNPQYPSFVAFDPAHLPTNVYLTCGAANVVVLQFI